MQSLDCYPKLDPLEDPTKIPPASSQAVCYVQRMNNYMRANFRGLAKEFDQRYLRWRFSVRLISPGGFPQLVHRKGGPLIQGRRFACLVELGGRIIPFLQKLMLGDDYFFAVVLYNQIEKSLRYKVNPNDGSNFSNYKRQANLILDLNLIRHTTFTDLVHNWRGYCTRIQCRDREVIPDIELTRNMWFKELVGMGQGTISRIMINYRENVQEPWYQFMGMLVDGEVYDDYDDGDDTNFNREELYELWRSWFEEEETDMDQSGGYVTESDVDSDGGCSRDTTD